MRIIVFLVGLVLFSVNVFGGTCWISEQPMGASLTAIGTSETVNWQKATYWLNYSGIASSSLKFTVKFNSKSLQKTHIQKFKNTPANFSTPFSIVSDSQDLIHGPASLSVKDDAGTCKANFNVVRVHKMDIGGPDYIADLSSGLCIGSSFLTTINTVAAVRVYLNIEHTSVGDLQVMLKAPDNSTVMLSNNNGGVDDNFGAGLGLVNAGYGWTPTVFDDQASTSITAGTPPFAGMYQPQSPLSAFNGFTGNQANGTWWICINDTIGGDAGYFIGATVEIVDQF